MVGGKDNQRKRAVGVTIPLQASVYFDPRSEAFATQ